MIRILFALLIVAMANPMLANGKFIIADKDGVVRDIASDNINLRRGYQFDGAKVYEIQDSIEVNLLDKYDGSKVIRYSGTEKQREIELIDYAVMKMEQSLADAPVEQKPEWQKVLLELKAYQEEIKR